MTAVEVTDFVQQTPELPVFRVHVWTIPVPGYAENLTAFRIEGAADVLEVIDWAQENYGTGRIEVLAEVDGGSIFSGAEGESALIPLYGWRPLQPPGGAVSFRKT